MEIVPVTDDLLPEFCEYIADNSDHESAEVVARVYDYPWLADRPNYGFALLHEGRVVGTFGCIYSNRLIDGEVERFCNTADWFVDEEHRSASIELLFAIISQPDYTFTALTSTAEVTQILRGFGFKPVDPDKVIVPTMAHAVRRLAAGSKTELITESAAIRDHLDDPSLQIFDDLHAGNQCDHLVLSANGAHCYVILRKQKRKRVPATTVLYASDVDVLAAGLGHLCWWLLTRQRVQALVLESALLPVVPRFSRRIEDPRPPLFSSKRLKADQVDSLYSELTR